MWQLSRPSSALLTATCSDHPLGYVTQGEARFGTAWFGTLDHTVSAIGSQLLLFNAGYSSLKYNFLRLGENSSLKAVASGLCEGIGDAAASVHRVSDP